MQIIMTKKLDFCKILALKENGNAKLKISF
jgi:hypothetical protein